MSPFFPSRPSVEPMIYAYEDAQYPGLLKVGYTTIGVQRRIAQQYPIVRPGERPYRIVLEEPAVRSDGTVFTDNERGGVHDTLRKMGIKNPGGEWFRCTVKEVRAAICAVRERREAELFLTETFGMRPEQRAAVEKTSAYFRTCRAENAARAPHFLWNCKMRFGKTFAAYQLAKEMGWKRLLVLTFKPAVQSAWETDLRTHVDFEGWQFISHDNELTYETADRLRPIVCFGSFQDYLGRTKAGGIKARNEWVHAINWDASFWTNTISAHGAKMPKNSSRTKTAANRLLPKAADWTISTRS